MALTRPRRQKKTREAALSRLSRLSQTELEAEPIEVLDRAAFGAAVGDEIEVPLHEVEIIYPGDLENAEWAVENDPERWRPFIDLPVDFRIQKSGHAGLDDGHHRFALRLKIGKKTIHGTVVDVEGNPIVRLEEIFVEEGLRRSPGAGAWWSRSDAGVFGAADPGRTIRRSWQRRTRSAT